MPTGVRALHAAAAVEALSLVVLVGNLLLDGSEALASLLGPLHGTCYLVVVALAFGLGLPRRVAWWSVLPGVGGLVVWSRARRSGTMTRS